MKTVLYFTFPVAGHVNPVLSTLKKLVDAKIRVVCYSTTHYQKQIEMTGACFKDYDDGNVHIKLDQNVPSQKITLLNLARLIIPFIEQRFEAMLKEAAEMTPDAIGFDFFALWGRMIAAALGTRAFTTISHLAPSQKKLDVFPGIMMNILELVTAGIPDMIKFRAISRRFHKRYHSGLYSIIGLFTNYSEKNVVLVNRELQPDLQDFDDSFVFAGPSIRRENHEEADAYTFPAGCGGALIYISLGTIYNKNSAFYTKCLELFGNTAYRVIMSVGGATNIEEFGAVPANIIVRNSVPQLSVLKQTDVFLTHGGMNSINEALSLGVKMIVFPQAVDQFANAKRLEQLGMAYYYKKKKPGSDLLSLITAILNDEKLVEKVEGFRKVMLDAEKERDAGDILISYINA